MTKHGELFNPKTIKKLCANVTITSTQKKAAAEWLKLLESGHLEKEKQHYFDFALIVLRDLLGYPEKSKDGMSYEEGNVEFVFSNNDGKRIICFEAKGTKTKDLFAPQYREKKEHSTPVKQTWDYMGTLNLDYGVATNYEQFVLIDKSKGTSKYHIFNFKDIKNNEDKLKEFIAIFSKENIIEKRFVATLYDQSVIEEKEFTKQFYKLFHETRLMLIKEFQSNEGITKDEAIHYAQLFLNRMTFIFFAEDTGKIPQRLVRDQMLKVLDAVPVSEHSRYACDTIYSIFESLDKGANTPVQIFGFNGGLFHDKIPSHFFFKDLTTPDFFKKEYQHSELKKKIKLDEFAEKIIKKYQNRINPIVTNLLYMSSFDFNSELNVNILGHIFEQSLTDLEELAGDDDSKRKKEGIFYTPEFVTDYICRHTIIQYLSQKGAMNAIDLINEYANDIEALEEKFKQIKILDPACGSGAFLLKAVDVLLEIHKEIQTFKEFKGQYSISIKGKKHKQITEQFTLTKWNEESEARKIIESNIFGVDINEESVEITKLSLFLKIATGNRKLIDLSNNIKIGNSLVDDKNIEKAFDWKSEFKEIMNQGGFDIIIGNPPYIRVQRIKHEVIDHLSSHYQSAFKKFDISLIFFEKSLQLIRDNGLIGFISSSQWMNTDYGQKLRSILSKGNVKEIVNFGSLPVFEDVSTYPAIFLLQRKKLDSMKYKKIEKATDLSVEGIESIQHGTVLTSELGENAWSFGQFILERHLTQNKIGWNSLSSYGHFYIGALTGMDNVFVVDQEKITVHKLEEKFLLPYAYMGKEVDSYQKTKPSEKIIYPYKPDTEGNSVLLTEEELKRQAPNIHKYLENEKDKLTKRMDSRKYYAKGDDWFRFLRQGKFSYIFPTKLIVRGITKNSCVGFLEKNSAFNGANSPAFIIEKNDYDWRFFLAILNSKVVSQYLRSVCPSKLQGYFRFNANNLNLIPIPTEVDEKIQNNLRELTEKMIELKEERANKYSRFLSRIRDNFNLEKISRKLQGFQLLKFQEFLKIINDEGKTKLSLKEQDEWDDYFNKIVPELNNLESQTMDCDDKINSLVYDIYKIGSNDRMVIEKDTE